MLALLLGMPRVLPRPLQSWMRSRRPGWCFVRRERPKPKSKAQTRVAGVRSLSDGDFLSLSYRNMIM